MKSKLSLIIPCYNEESFIQTVLAKVFDAALPAGVDREVVVVDDGSTDQTFASITSFRDTHPSLSIQVIRHEKNRGKGASIRSALPQTTGDIILVQDADLEYSPSDYGKLLAPILEGHADVVFGSRFRGGDPHRVLFFFHSGGNKLLTFVSNLFTGINLSDMETGYKMFRKEALLKVNLKENRFGFEPEVTAKISRVKKIRIYEVGISYYGRTYADGKKIRWVDGLRALYCVLKYNIFSRK